MIDLPRLANDKSADSELTLFGQELFHFAQAMGLDEKLITSLRKFDFSRTSHLAFVHSMLVPSDDPEYLCDATLTLDSGGSHSGKDIKRTGYCGLGNAVRNLGLQTEDMLDVDVVVCITHMHFEEIGYANCDEAASIGNLNDGFVKSMYLAAQGMNVPSLFASRRCAHQSPWHKKLWNNSIGANVVLMIFRRR